MFLARLSGGGLARFEATRLATGYHNANRFEIHGDRGALRFDFERMNELGLLRRDRRRRDRRAGRRSTSPAAATAIPTPLPGGPTATGSATSTAFVNQAADILTDDRRRRPGRADARLRGRACRPSACSTPRSSPPATRTIAVAELTRRDLLNQQGDRHD